MKRFVVKTEDLKFNIDRLKELTAPCRIIAVLKGDAYGLGIVQAASIMAEQGIDFFAVSELCEARTLREAGFSQDILLLSSGALPCLAEGVAELGLIASAGSMASLESLNNQGREVRVHIKMDTGFGRFGFLPSQVVEVARYLRESGNIRAEGIFSHLSFSFEESGASSRRQYEKFLACLEAFEREGISFSCRHIANSCAALKYPEMHLDAIRIGSAFLGRLPMPQSFGLRRIGKLRAIISETRMLPRGHNTGYADTFKTKRDTRIAVIPIGYKDGFGVERARDTFRIRDFLRNAYLSRPFQKLHVSINGKDSAILGRVGMYNIIADITDISAEAGDEAILPCNPILLASEVERIYE